MIKDLLPIKINVFLFVRLSVSCLSPLMTSGPLDRFARNFVFIIWGPIKTDYKEKKSKIGKKLAMFKIEFQNLVQTIGLTSARRQP